MEYLNTGAGSLITGIKINYCAVSWFHYEIQEQATSVFFFFVLRRYFRHCWVCLINALLRSSISFDRGRLWGHISASGIIK